MLFGIGRIARTKVGEYTVNTTTLTLGYETAIKQVGGDWIVVQQYCTREKAKMGHQYWVRFCTDNPDYAYDVIEKKYKIF